MDAILIRREAVIVLPLLLQMKAHLTVLPEWCKDYVRQGILNRQDRESLDLAGVDRLRGLVDIAHLMEPMVAQAVLDLYSWALAYNDGLNLKHCRPSC